MSAASARTSLRAEAVQPCPRLIAGLLYLQHANDGSDEVVVATCWRKRIGEEGVEVLLAVTIEAARAAGLIKKGSVNRVIVDITVMPKATRKLDQLPENEGRDTTSACLSRSCGFFAPNMG